jgi:hypothetical protein
LNGPEIIVFCAASFAFLAVLVGVPVYDRERLQHWRWNDWAMTFALAAGAANVVLFLASVAWVAFGGGD